jgi:hypothetical protein
MEAVVVHGMAAHNGAERARMEAIERVRRVNAITLDDLDSPARDRGRRGASKPDDPRKEALR